MDYDRSEQPLKFLRAVFPEPTVSLWLRAHHAFVSPRPPGNPIEYSRLRFLHVLLSPVVNYFNALLRTPDDDD
jgi:hypothetical protein